MNGDKARGTARVLLNVLGFGLLFGAYVRLAGLLGISPGWQQVLIGVAGSLLAWISYRLFGRA
jgi:hypothetical protein